jgi:membrane protein implicated in regulation of membrane protease activity
MSQTKKASFMEAVMNTVVGYGLSVLTYQLVMPILGYNTSLKENVILVAVLSVVSIIRNYLIRRFFAKRENENEHGKQAS